MTAAIRTEPALEVGSHVMIRACAASKAYLGVHAIEAVDFDVRAGEVHALMGENGAGKSTLCKALAGVVQLSSGHVEVDGQRVDFAGPADGLAAGVTMVFQETSLVPSMTVAQNLFLGKESAFMGIRPTRIEAQQLLQSLGFHVDPNALVGRLSAAQKQMVEIARAVFHKSRVMIFDEPTATLTPEEKQHFFHLLEKLKRDKIAIVFISHNIEEALKMSDRISVLRDGRLIVTNATQEFDRASVVRYMVGRDVDTSRKERAARPRGAKVLSVENVTMGDVVKNTSFSVYAGEITCMAGLIGSGRTEMMKIVAGALKRDFLHGGMIYLDGRPVRYRTPAQAIADGIVYVTEDRKLNGFFETMGIADNIYLGWLVTNGRQILTSSETRAAVASDWLQRLNVRSINMNARVNELSGGNQQKVVIAKSLVQKPRLVIFDEPTRGVDVGAIAEIHTFIRRLAEDGVAVVVISSYLPEVLQLADRVLVVRQGRVVEEIAGAEADEETIMFAAVH